MSTRGDLIVMTPSKNAISALIKQYDWGNFLTSASTSATAPW